MKKIYRERVKRRPTKYTAVTGHFYYAKYSAAVPVRADVVRDYLDSVNSIFRVLFSDENFLTLMRAESVTIPFYFNRLLEKSIRVDNTD